LVGSPPTYKFLAPDQVGTADGTGNPRPWTRLSPHLLLTGNTFALVSRDGPVLLVDPYGPNMAARVEQLRTEHGTGPLEVAVISHAHNDHYTGIFNMPRRDAFQVWTLNRVADAVDHPEKYRAPYVDARRPRVDRTPRDGETVKWREYELKFHHFPGQTEFTNAIETTIDGRRCWFTADNFFHVDQYSGSGGWSALNRALPGGYARSARKILDAAPEWILAEHGGPFEFNAEDFRRREAWAVDSGRAADRLSPSGDLRHDWDLHRVRLEPLIAATTAGATRDVSWIVSNPLSVDVELNLLIESPLLAAPVQSQLTVPAGGAASQSVRLSVAAGLKVGRHPVPAVVTRTRTRTRTTRDAADAADSADTGKGAGKNRMEDDPADVFVVLDVR
ncbi:MAG TPA: MBL fold metallo-hydrolase, partial [Pirellulaceae bacterium]|nr:MBL fold metallo-hydrolase [Pirellulaceae bacterium]